MNKKKLFWGVTFIVAVIVCVICGYKIISYFLSDGGNSAEYINPETETNAATLVNTVENHNINWVKLQEKNSDVYSWIYIPNTNVHYPVAVSYTHLPIFVSLYSTLLISNVLASSAILFIRCSTKT